ncbi:MAG: hypothetical protein RIQ47_468 [Bacteroidota bacterium]|jgi:hypothetical protein
MQNLKNTLLTIAAWILGALANGFIINIGGFIIPLPAGADVSTPEGLAASMPLMQSQHFITPLIAHAGGTFIGAWLVCRFISENQLMRAMIIGFLFFAAGLYMTYILPAPMWFEILDMTLAYFPMAYLGYKTANR